MSRCEESKKRLVEFLWAEINRAILRSPDVRSSVKSLQALDLLNYVSDYNLVLDVKTLVEMIIKDEEGDALSSLEDSAELGADEMVPKFLDAPRENREVEDRLSETGDEAGVAQKPSGQRIDGRVLSENEVRFQERLQEEFDEEAWMKQAGIHFMDEA
jgi:hypothetical protein